MKKYLSNTALLLEAVGLVLMFTRDSWGANKPLYAFTGCALLFIGFSILTHQEFSRPFHSVSRSKKIGVIFRICLVAILAIWLVYDIYLMVLGLPVDIENQEI